MPARSRSSSGGAAGGDHGRPHAWDGRARGDEADQGEGAETAVLIFTAYSERSLLGRGLESGAKGYILKEAPHATLLRAIEKVAGGESFVDPALMPTFLTGKEQNDMLTAREREILQLLADGMSNADVAARLFISQETVKSHVRHILAKLEADTRTHAVAIALRDAIID